MANEEATSGEDVEGGHVVDYEEDIRGDEEEVVEGVCDEVGYAVVEDCVLEVGVGGGKGGGWVVMEREGGEKEGWGAMG